MTYLRVLPDSGKPTYGYNGFRIKSGMTTYASRSFFLRTADKSRYLLMALMFETLNSTEGTEFTEKGGVSLSVSSENSVFFCVSEINHRSARVGQVTQISQIYYSQ